MLSTLAKFVWIFDIVVSAFTDLYAFTIGCYVLGATAAAIQYVVDYLRTHDIRVFLRQVVKWSSIVAKSFVLLSLWVRAAPLASDSTIVFGSINLINQIQI